jgi:hypothetical protein
VNGYAVRDVAQPDEEFGCFATQDEFPDLIPEGEVWLAQQTIPKEGLFFIANALTQLKEQARGVPEEKAYTAGINVERMLRERLNHLKFRGAGPQKRVPKEVYLRLYATLPDKNDTTVEVWIVDGNVVRSLYKAGPQKRVPKEVYLCPPAVCGSRCRRSTVNERLWPPTCCRSMGPSFPRSGTRPGARRWG